MKTILKFLVPLALLAVAPPASANVITFETVPAGTFTGPAVEDGFVYSKIVGDLRINTLGNPGRDMEGDPAGRSDANAALAVAAENGGLFTFNRVDFAAFDDSRVGAIELNVCGFRMGGFIGCEQFLLSTTDVTSPTLGNWTREYATLGGLSGAPVDSLSIGLPAVTDRTMFFAAIDNLVLTPVIAESPTLALAGAGLLGFAARRRAKR